MSYKVRVIAQVVNEDGDVVDFKGNDRYNKRFIAPGIQVALDLFGEQPDIDVARENLNKMYNIIKNIKELK